MSKYEKAIEEISKGCEKLRSVRGLHSVDPAWAVSCMQVAAKIWVECNCWGDPSVGPMQDSKSDSSTEA